MERWHTDAPYAWQQPCPSCWLQEKWPHIFEWYLYIYIYIQLWKGSCTCCWWWWLFHWTHLIKKKKKWSSRIAAPFIPHTCEVVQRRALHPKAQHLLHRQIKRIILVRCHVSAAAAARVRTPLYRIAVLGFKRRHGWGNRGGIWIWGGSPRRGSPLPVPLLRLDVRLRSGKGRADGWSVHPRWWCRWRLYGGHDEDGSGSSGRETHGRLVLHQLALLHNP